MIWENRFLPPEPDDSFSYVSGIKIIGDNGSYFSNLEYIMSSDNNDHLIYLPWKTFLLITSLIGDFQYVDVYHANFFFGLLIFPIILLSFLKTIDKSTLFLIVSFAFLLLYNGAGEYHGFFWVVPSFYSLLATLLLLSVLFDKNKLFGDEKIQYVLICIFTFWVVWSHPLGKFSFFALSFSFFIFFIFENAFKKPNLSNFFVRKGLILVFSGLIIIFSLEIFPYWVGFSPSRYYSFAGVVETSLVASNALNIFQKLYLDYFTFNSPNLILLLVGLFGLSISKKHSLLSLFGSFFIFSFFACLFSPIGYRFLVYLWPITFIVFSYGLYYLIKTLFNYLNDIFFQTRFVFRKNNRCFKEFILFSFLLVLVCVNYLNPFITSNYEWNNRFANYQNQQLFDSYLNLSIIDYVEENTNPNDLIIFSDSNAFMTLTSVGLNDRRVAYSDWDWQGDYFYLKNDVNNSFLISTGEPAPNSVQNFSMAFENKIKLVFLENFGLLNMYKIVLFEHEQSYLFGNEGNKISILADDLQTNFWNKTNFIQTSEDFTLKMSGFDCLKIDVMQTQKSQNDFIFHTFLEPQNWSEFDLFSFYWYGNNTDNQIELLIFAPDSDNRVLFSFVDDFIGWKRIVFSLNSSQNFVGHPSIKNINSIYFRFLISAPYNCTYYLDQLSLDIDFTEHQPEPIFESNFQNLFVIIAFLLFFSIFPGLIWSKFVFELQNLTSILASSIGFSFSVLFLGVFLPNLLFNVDISRTFLIIILSFFALLPFVIKFAPSIKSFFEKLFFLFFEVVLS